MGSAIPTISKYIGRLVVFGIPLIIGGGIVYHFTGSYPAIFIYEVILIFTALGFIDG